MVFKMVNNYLKKYNTLLIMINKNKTIIIKFKKILKHNKNQIFSYYLFLIQMR
jgi:hypothetical protein